MTPSSDDQVSSPNPKLTTSDSVSDSLTVTVSESLIHWLSVTHLTVRLRVTLIDSDWVSDWDEWVTNDWPTPSLWSELSQWRECDTDCY